MAFPTTEKEVRHRDVRQMIETDHLGTPLVKHDRYERLQRSGDEGLTTQKGGKTL
jgi:hypothetical protein